MESDRTLATTQASSFTPARTKTARQSESVDGHSFCLEDRDPVGVTSTRNGLRLRHDLLATLARVATGGGLAALASRVTGATPPRRPARLVTRRGGQQFSARRAGWKKTGRNPTDRGKPGSKHHVITDAQGIPLATTLTGANAPDVTQLLLLVEAIPTLQGKRGRPRCRPERVQGDRGYDSDPHRHQLRTWHIQPVIARRYTEHGSGLGAHRWGVERTIAWLHQFRRLRVRFERLAEIHEAFLSIGCSLICLRFL